MIGLLRLLRHHGEAVEADLARYYGVDYRDRWRTGPDGRSLLTLRMIAVRLRHLPPESAVMRLSGDPWSVELTLLADIWQAIAGSKTRHPALQAALDAVRQATHFTPRRRAALARARHRLAERRRAIEAGEI